MLIRHRLRNHNWVRVQLESPDPRIRANVVEGLWGMHTSAARECMWEAFCRMKTAALMGLHLLGDLAAGQLVEQMLEALPHFAPHF